jgi:hypothetical protein
MKCTEPVPRRTLCPRDVDLEATWCTLCEEFAELQNGARLHGRPKSDALPSPLVAVVGEDRAFARMRGRCGNPQALPVPRSVQQKKQVGGKVWGEHAGVIHRTCALDTRLGDHTLPLSGEAEVPDYRRKGRRS